MELVCEKYKEKMESSKAHCRHPNDYCQTRNSCMIHFIGQEKEREERQNAARKEQNKK